MQIHTRKQAADLGMHKYWTGKSCRNGHTALRYVDTGACTRCLSLYAKRYHDIRRRAKNDRLAGLVAVTVYVYPQDVDAIKARAEGLKLARELSW